MLLLKLKRPARELADKKQIFNMKKLLLAAVVCCSVVFSTQAQDKKVTFGVRAGLNFDSQTMSGDGISIKTDSKAGFHAGVVADINFAKYFYLQPGLLFTTKGTKVENLSLYYLEVPLIVSFAYPLTEDLKVRADVGPALGLGLFGSAGSGDESSSKGIFSKETEEHEYEDNQFIVEYGPAYNRFNLGLKFGIGVEWKQYSFGVHYNAGLSNILHTEGESDSSASLRNNSFTIGLGYNF
jgi:hypothetical protein